MTAAAAGRNTVQLDPGKPIPFTLVYPVAASTKIYQGTLVALNAAGNAVPASAAINLRVVGVAVGPGDAGLVGDVDNSSGAAGALTVRVASGAFPFTANTTIAKTDLQKPVYAVDDSTVDLSDAGGTRPFAGIVVGTDSLLGTTSLGAYVLVGGLAQLAGGGSAVAENLAPAVAPLWKARAVATSALAAYTAVAGVITENANGALGSVFDGVTIVAGDVVFLPEGIAAAAKDAGPYVVTSLGGASAKFVLTRPDWYVTGGTIQAGLVIEIGGEGTLFMGTAWKSFVVAGKLVDTDAPLFWPREVLQSVVLVAGTATITNVPTKSATKSAVFITRQVANTSTATTGGYHATVAGANGVTPGVLGTASIVIQATVAAGTISAADVSTVGVLIKNW